MSDCMTPVTGTSSIVGFANQGNNRHGENHYHWDRDCGISDKDQGYASTVEANERTRDILHGQRFSDNVNSQHHSATHVAIEKTGAANELATEKVGAAAVIATERNGTVLQVQAERIRADAALQAERVRAELSAQAERYQIANTLAMSDFRREATKDHCEVLAKLAECCCETKALIKEVEANRVRDDLAQCRAELLAIQRVN